jgi:RNA polymerase sigma-70 factor (ECF subfamily)
MHWRSRSKRGHSQPSVRWEEELDRLSVQGSEMLDRAALTERMEEYARLHQSVQALPEKYQTVLILRYFEDLPVAEIAEATSTRVGTVRSLIHRGLKRLRRVLERNGATFP